MTYLIVWEFRPRPGMEREFELAYGSKGEWATLFAQSPDYLGTELCRDPNDPTRYLTLDRWRSREAFETFRRLHSREYEILDRRFEALTSHEAQLGSFERVEG
jgi:heme-degrading monooxygenase HmoA